MTYVASALQTSSGQESCTEAQTVTIRTLLIGDGLVKRLQMHELNEAASPTPLQACCLCWAWIAAESLRGAWRATQLFQGENERRCGVQLKRLAEVPGAGAGACAWTVAIRITKAQ